MKDVRGKCALHGRFIDFIPADLTTMIDVTVENFEAEVILASNELPVLVDFWAPWCGDRKSVV